MVNTINIFCYSWALLPTDESEVRLKRHFHDYYSNWSGEDVDLISEREIGFIPFFGTMIRHRAVLNLKGLERFVYRNTPRHIYYSSAYYRKPEEKVMKEKEWKGAELIFDLDADHLEGAEKMTYAQILAEVKKHTERLISRFLMDDLGFQEKDLKLLFSGGRGYHVHVVEDSVYPLTSDARREIANYIRGEGLSTFDIRRSMQDTKARLSGWKKSLDDEMCGFYSDILEDTDKQEILHKVLGNSRTLASYLAGLRKAANTPENLKRQELFSVPGNRKYRLMNANDEKVLGYMIEMVKKEYQCEIDEPVTTDIHRLIRLPHSLHGKTGLMVKPISLDSFKEFDPLRDAVAPAFSERSAKVNVLRHFKIDFAGESFNLPQGEAEVPLSLAVFMVSAKFAKFV